MMLPTQYVRGTRRYLHLRMAEEELDEAAVECLLAGYPVLANYKELDAAIERLDELEIPTRTIAERLGICRETVLRHRRRRAALAMT